MDKNDSYFHRSFWFVWIGYVTSLLAFLLIGMVGALDLQKRLFEIRGAHYWTNGLVSFVSVVCGHFLLAYIKSLIQQTKSPAVKVDGGNTQKLGQMGMALVYYTALLTIIEVPALISFVIGFLGGEFHFMLPYIATALVLQFLSVPKRLI